VTSDEGENLRRDPNGPVVGRVREGTLLERVGKKGKWFQVRREGWVPRKAVARAQAQGRAAPPQGTGRHRPPTPAAKPPAAAPAKAPTPSAGPAEGVEVARETGLAREPDSTPYATLQPGVAGRVLGRSGEWVRVQLDGWIREADLKPADNGVLRDVSAEVRTCPTNVVSRSVAASAIAVQTADGPARRSRRQASAS
jgi:hypothetical protein